MDISKELLKDKLSEFVDSLAVSKSLQVDQAISHFESIVQHENQEQDEEEAKEENVKVIDCVVEFLFSDTYWLAEHISEKSLKLVTEFIKDNEDD